MRKFTLVCALTICLAANDNTLEIYKNRSFLHQNFVNQKSSFSIFLPVNINQSEIDITASCDIKSLIINEPEYIKNDIYERYESRLKKLKFLKNRLTALDEQFKFITVTNAIKQSDINNLKADSDKFYDAVLSNLNEAASLREEIVALDKEIASFDLKKVEKADLSFECDPKFVKISYPINIYMRLQNKILADTTRSKIDIEQNLVVKNPLSIDLNSLDITLYPFAYASNLTPPTFYPHYEGKPTPERSFDKNFAPVAEERIDVAAVKKLSEHTYNSQVQSQNLQNTIANVWKISNVKLKAHEESVFSYDKQSLDAEFEIVIDGYSGSNAYIKANFTPTKSIEYAQTAFKIDGVSVGQASNFKAGGGIQSHVYLGKSDLIDVKKEKNANFTKESFFGSKSKILESYDYDIKNNSNIAWKVTLIDRLPISTHESVTVTSKNIPKESEISKKGEVSWKFDLKPKESRKIEFTYELIRPSE